MSRRRREVPQPIVQDLGERKQALRVLATQATFDPNSFLFDDRFKAGGPDFRSVHTVPEIMACLEANPSVQAEGIFIEASSKGNYHYRKLNNREQIRETWDKNKRIRNFREAKFREDSWGSSAGSNAGLVGDDYIPLLGGPFNKQPYLYDYLRAHAYCFHEYHHHPFARATVHITRDFVLGRGYRVDCEDDRALALWRAFEEVNRLEEMMEDIVKEGSIYGENLIWWLPNQEVYIGYQDRPGQQPAKGIIPRIRMVDPSTCWEIVTYPEDITRVLFYQLVFPTQYQIYTCVDKGSPVPTSKFIMQQIPAADMMHFKYNCVSNEKRGRSDLFPVLGYLKWLRDCVNYKLISLKKQSAWTEDIVVEGSQADVDQITAAFKAMGEFEPAGSRFVHTDKIKREYLANQGKSGGKDETLEWGINMIAAGVQIPVTYYGLSHSAGQTRASAIVGTEPVAKKFERRQKEVGRIIKAMWRRFQDQYGIAGAECEVTFPEIITQDRAAKLKDIKFVEDCGYISRETAAPLAAKELDLDKYEYDEEKAKIDAEEDPPIRPTLVAPLTAPATAPPASSAGTPSAVSLATGSKSAVTSQDRRDIKTQDRNV